MTRSIRFILIAFVILAIPFSALADENSTEMVATKYLNIPVSAYNQLRKIYSEDYIYVMTESDYNRIINLNLNFDSVQRHDTYIKTTYNNITGEKTETIISEEEYNSSGVMPLSTEIETQYKQIWLTLLEQSGGYAYFTFTARWKYLPAVRSFDVIGARLANFRVLNGTQQGKQIYTLNDEVDYVQYNFNGTNINNLDNGFGISMNLVNSNITSLECTIDSTLIIDAYAAVIHTSYQHAVRNVTLAQSKNYYIEGAGLGDVFHFYDGIGSYYDDMQGLYDYLQA